MSQNPMGNFLRLSTTAAKSITTTTSVHKCTPKEAHKILGTFLMRICSGRRKVTWMVTCPYSYLIVLTQGKWPSGYYPLLGVFSFMSMPEVYNAKTIFIFWSGGMKKIFNWLTPSFYRQLIFISEGITGMAQPTPKKPSYSGSNAII